MPNTTFPLSLSVAIPTYGRETVLLETLDYLLPDVLPRHELILVDQSPQHDEPTWERLTELREKRFIRVFTQSPSIPRAMNRALQEARGEIVLFLDDDIIPGRNLITAHLRAHDNPDIVAAVGQVLQPGEEPEAIEHQFNQSQGALAQDMHFCFRSTISANVTNVMAGNLSVKRDVALAIGGFDENFVGVAYRFETEFARRLSRVGTIRYQPSASIRHLAAARGGTRSFGTHLTTHRPEHSVGDYYFALLHGSPLQALRYCTRRLVTSTATRFHLARPWYIPPKLLGELRGLVWALQLRKQGPKLLHPNATHY